jgi:hypothetical protein
MCHIARDTPLLVSLRQIQTLCHNGRLPAHAWASDAAADSAVAFQAAPRARVGEFE